MGKCEFAATHKQVVRATQRINVECASSGNIAGARALIEELILGRGLKPTLVTANVLIKTYRTARHPEGAEAVLREMGVWGLCPDACTFSTLVDAYGLTGRVSDAQRLVAAAEDAGVADVVTTRPDKARSLAWLSSSRCEKTWARTRVVHIVTCGVRVASWCACTRRVQSGMWLVGCYLFKACVMRHVQCVVLCRSTRCVVNRQSSRPVYRDS